MTSGVILGLVAVVDFFLTAFQYLVFASVVVSWVGDRSNQIVVIIQNMTEPLYRPLRTLTRKIPGPFDWAPMILLAIILFIQIAGLRPLKQYANDVRLQENAARLGPE